MSDVFLFSFELKKQEAFPPRLPVKKEKSG